MNKKLLALLILLTVTTVNTIGMSWGADKEADSKTVKKQSLTIPGVKEAVVNATGYEIRNIKIESTAHRLTITAVDNTLNTASSKDRESEASKMTSALANVINGKVEFAQVTIIHVDYVKSLGNNKSIEAFEFYKTPAGSFVIHKS